VGGLGWVELRCLVGIGGMSLAGDRQARAFPPGLSPRPDPVRALHRFASVKRSCARSHQAILSFGHTTYKPWNLIRLYNR